MQYHSSIEVFDLLDRWNSSGPPNVDLLRDLFRREPDEARRVSNIKNRTLLHKCLEYHGTFKKNEDLVRLLVEFYPDAVSIQDDDGYLPLHLAVCNVEKTSSGLSVVQFLVEMHPESVITETNEGQLPLHLACQSGCNVSKYDDDQLEALKFLVRTFPDALHQRDDANCFFPLDYAVDVSGNTSTRK